MIIDNRYFNVKATLECGQVFRFKAVDDGYEVVSADKRCFAYPKGNSVEIITAKEHENYFFNYFDLGRDYGALSENLAKFDELRQFEGDCGGIHILRQDLFETIISFVISANNNISRIKGIVERLCARYGEKKDGYFAFPVPEQLKDCVKQDYEELGAGYRSAYIQDTVQTLLNTDLLNELKTMDYPLAIKALMKLKGVGRKVADCVALFALNHTNCYPVDTNIFKSDSSQAKSQKLLNEVRDGGMKRYGGFAGFAQQWKFYSQIKK